MISWWHHGMESFAALRWRHNGPDSVSNHQPHHCLLNCLFRRRSKKTSKLRVTGLCVGNSPGPVNSPHKWPVTRIMFPFDDVIMVLLALCQVHVHCKGTVIDLGDPVHVFTGNILCVSRFHATKWPISRFRIIFTNSHAKKENFTITAGIANHDFTLFFDQFHVLTHEKPLF